MKFLHLKETSVPNEIQMKIHADVCDVCPNVMCDAVQSDAFCFLKNEGQEKDTKGQGRARNL